VNTVISEKLPLRKFNEEDYDKLSDLNDAVWGIAGTKQYWQWKYGYGDPNNRGYIVESDEGNVVGATGYWNPLVRIKGYDIPGTMLIDMMTHPELRGKAYRPIAAETKKIPYSRLFMGFPNKVSNRYYVTLWRHEDVFYISKMIPRWVTLLNPSGHITAPNIVKNVAETIGKLSWKCRLANLFTNSKYTVKKADSIDNAFDVLWDDLKNEYPYIQYRNTLYLKWRYEQCPAKTFEIWKCFSDNTMIGYMVLFIPQKKKRGFIIDWFVSRSTPDAFHALLHNALQSFLTHSVSEVETWLFDHETQWTNILRRYFFIRKETERFYLIVATNEILHGETVKEDELFVTMGDADTPGMRMCL
jgi:hypothetical protein